VLCPFRTGAMDGVTELPWAGEVGPAAMGEVEGPGAAEEPESDSMSVEAYRHGVAVGLEQEEWQEFADFVRQHEEDGHWDALALAAQHRGAPQDLEYGPPMIGPEDEDADASGSFESAVSMQSPFESWAVLGPLADRFSAPPKLRLNHSLLWEVVDLPLGYENLAGFGPNGPPMNVLDFCPATEQVFVANQRSLYSFSVPQLQALSSEGGGGAAVGEEVERLTELPAQVNRIRCGRLVERPVVVAVGARGHVTVVAADADRSVAATLQNVAHDRGLPVSTWGLALAPHWCPDRSGELAVSANDHCIKSWTACPDELRGGPSSVSSSASPFSPPPWPRRGVGISGERWSFLGAEGTANGRGRLLVTHEMNIPCIDLVDGRLLSASLDGSVHVERLDAGARGAPCSVSTPVHAEGMWAAAWLPLRSLRTDASLRGPTPEVGGKEGGGLRPQLQWVASGVLLPEEIIATSVLPLLSTADLLQILQLLSRGHSLVACAEVVAAHRRELLALCFSSSEAWLLDENARWLCRQPLPFNGTYAHVAYSSELSTLAVATKMDTTSETALWTVTPIRRRGSLRFSLQFNALPYAHPESTSYPQGVILGMAACSGGRLLTLTANRRLACHGLSLEKQPPPEGLAAAGDDDAAARGDSREAAAAVAAAAATQ